jgi:cell shape-determining protein MreD
MAAVLFRCLLVLSVIVSEVTVSHLFSGSYQPPSAFLALVAAWTVHAGFAAAMSRIILAGAVLDIFAYGRFGLSVAVAVFIGYIVGFLSRRFLIQHRFWGGVVMVGILIFSTWLYNGIRALLLFGQAGQSPVASASEYFFSVSVWRDFLAASVANVIFFFAALWLVRRIESYASSRSRRVRPKHHA